MLVHYVKFIFRDSAKNKEQKITERDDRLVIEHGKLYPRITEKSVVAPSGAIAYQFFDRIEITIAGRKIFMGKKKNFSFIRDFNFREL